MDGCGRVLSRHRSFVEAVVKPKFSGKVEHGKLTLYDRDAFAQYVSTFNGKPVFITIERESRTRSNPQNAYLWGVVYKLIADHVGDDVDSIHEEMKTRFIPKHVERINVETGEVEELTVAGSTRKLTTQEFSDYVESIQRWAASFLGLVIPDPGEVSLEN